MNSVVHKVNCFTPFFLMHGTEAMLPLDCLLRMFRRTKQAHITNLFRIFQKNCTSQREQLKSATLQTFHQLLRDMTKMPESRFM